MNEDATVVFSWVNTGGEATSTLLDVDGDGTADYTLTTEVSQAHAYPAAGTYTPTVTLANGAGSDNATGPAVVVSVAGTEQLLRIVTLTEDGTGGAKTNEVVQIGQPMLGSFLAPGETLIVYDDDGSGGKGSVLANFQLDHDASDDAGSQRFKLLTGIVPSLGSGATRKLRVYSTTASPPSGAAITVSDIQALGGYTNGLVKVTMNIGGTDYAVSVKDILDGGSTTFSKTGFNIAADKVREGPTCTEWRLMAAPRNGGSAQASGNGLWVEFHLAAFKASAAAVSGGNPITAIYCDVIRRNSAADRATGDKSHQFYGLKTERATSLSDATLIATDQTDPLFGVQRYDYQSSQPAATLTLNSTHVGINNLVLAFDAQTSNFTIGQTLTGGTSGATATITGVSDSGTTGVVVLGGITGTFADNESITDGAGGSATANGVVREFDQVYPYPQVPIRFTRSTGVWPADILGAAIVNSGGAGKAIVNSRISDTVVEVWIVEAFSTASYTSGNWGIVGVAHYYGSRHWDRLWIGNKPSSVTLWGEHTSAVTPTTRAAMDDLVDTEMTVHYALAFASVSHSMTRLDAAKGDGAIRPGTVRGASGGSPGYVGDIYSYIGGTGLRDDIGLLPSWQVSGLIKYDANGRRKMFENAKHWMLYHYPLGHVHTNSPTNGSKGVSPRSDGGTSSYSSGQFGTYPAHWVTEGNTAIFDTDTAHHPAGPYLPYILTGAYVFLQELQEQATHFEWTTGLEGYSGIGATRGPWAHSTDASTWGPQGQVRAFAWRYRDRLHSAAVTPDAGKPTLWNAKSYESARLAMNKGSVNSTAGILNATRHPTGATTSGLFDYLWGTFDPGAGVRYDGWWQTQYIGYVFVLNEYLGYGDADSDAFIEFLCNNVEAYDDINVVGKLLTPSYSSVWWRGDESRYATSVAEVYQWACHFGPANSGGAGLSRVPTGTLTLSDSSVGTGRTFTFSNSYFASGGTGTSGWYVGGYIRSGSSIAKITSVTSATEVVATIITAFSSTTPTISGVTIPGPHPSDYTGYADTLNSQNSTQVQSFVGFARMAARFGKDYSATVSAETGRTGFQEIQPQFYVLGRA